MVMRIPHRHCYALYVREAFVHDIGQPQPESALRIAGKSSLRGGDGNGSQSQNQRQNFLLSMDEF